MPVLSVDSLVEYVSERGFGWYQIRDRRPDGPMLDCSHVGDESDKAVADDDAPKVSDVPTRLRSVLDRFGAGTYVVLLKNKPNSKATTVVQQMVQVQPDASSHHAQGNTFAGPPSGLGYVAREEAAQMVNDALSRYREEDRRDRELADLRRELAEARSGGVPPAWLDKISDVLHVVAVAVTAKVAPEALPVISGLFQTDTAAPPADHSNELLQ